MVKKTVADSDEVESFASKRRNSASAEGPRDALCQSKSCQVEHRYNTKSLQSTSTLKVIEVAANR